MIYYNYSLNHIESCHSYKAKERQIIGKWYDKHHINPLYILIFIVAFIKIICKVELNVLINVSITSYPTNARQSSAFWWNSDWFWNDDPVPNWGLPPKTGTGPKPPYEDWLLSGISPTPCPFKQKMKSYILFSSTYGTIWNKTMESRN